MALQKYTKASTDRKRYQINYDDWLDTGEGLLAVVFTVESNLAAPLLVVDGVQILPDSRSVQYYVAGGVDGVTYRILADATTTTGPQQKLDEILMTIREP